MPAEQAVYLGVDVGATKILAGIFRTKGEGAKLGEALGQVKAKTPRTGKAKDLVAAILAVAGEAAAEAAKAGYSLAAAGVAVPGPLDREQGIVRFTPNLGLEDYPLAAELRAALGYPVFLENDVQSGVLGELVGGGLRGMTNAVGIFLGTGIGGGIVIDGKIYRGSTGSAGEIGHMILLEGGPLCGCGNYGCLEALASRTAMAKDAIALASSGKSEALLDAAGSDFRKYRSSAFEEALDAGDEAAGRIVDRAGFWLGVGLANIVNLLNPEAILLGGGVVSRFGKRLRDAARLAMDDRLMPGLPGTVQLVLAELGDLAVPAGCAVAAARELAGGGPR
jgi:glucokinase